MIIEVHLLQSFPVSNLNRDDVGQPKSVHFGGHNRARVSSQSWKRAARLKFGELGLAKDHQGIRTKRLRDAAVDVLTANGRDRELAPEVVQAGLAELGFTVDNRGLTQYLFYVGTKAKVALAEYCDENWDTLAKTARGDKPVKKSKSRSSAADEAVRKILDAAKVADIGLFGRMVADNTNLSVNAACQVAHAISTHQVANEYDYYTAVDDLRSDAEPGADMIGTVDYNAACYYRYANTDLAQLATNLPGDPELVKQAVEVWLRAFITAVPGGKQNSMAAPTQPEVMLGVVRDAGSWNLANAFLKPVRADYIDVSAQRMMDHFSRIRGYYGNEQLRNVTYGALNPAAFTLTDADQADSVTAFISKLTRSAKL